MATMSPAILNVLGPDSSRALSSPLALPSSTGHTALAQDRLQLSRCCFFSCVALHKLTASSGKLAWLAEFQ